MRDVLDEVANEMTRQLMLWGEQNHASGTGSASYRADRQIYQKANEKAVKAGTLVWALILLEEVFEAVAEKDPEKLRTELTQVAAVACSWIQSIDRNGK